MRGRGEEGRKSEIMGSRSESKANGSSPWVGKAAGLVIAPTPSNNSNKSTSTRRLIDDARLLLVFPPKDEYRSSMDVQPHSN